MMFDRRGQLRRVGTSDLTAWWPVELGLTDNWWRSFWQTNLLAGGVPSRAIDRLLRHVSAGERPMTSDRGDSPVQLAQEVTSAMGAEHNRLGIAPFRGLAT